MSDWKTTFNNYLAHFYEDLDQCPTEPCPVLADIMQYANS